MPTVQRQISEAIVRRDWAYHHESSCSKLRIIILLFTGICMGEGSRFYCNKKNIDYVAASQNRVFCPRRQRVCPIVWNLWNLGAETRDGSWTLGDGFAVRDVVPKVLWSYVLLKPFPGGRNHLTNIPKVSDLSAFRVMVTSLPTQHWFSFLDGSHGGKVPRFLLPSAMLTIPHHLNWKEKKSKAKQCRWALLSSCCLHRTIAEPGLCLGCLQQQCGGRIKAPSWRMLKDPRNRKAFTESMSKEDSLRCCVFLWPLTGPLQSPDLQWAWQNGLGSGWNILQRHNPRVAGPAAVICMSAFEASGVCRRDSHGNPKSFVSPEAWGCSTTVPKAKVRANTLQVWERERGPYVHLKGTELQKVENTFQADEWVAFSKSHLREKTAPHPKSEKVLGKNS